MMHQNLRKRSRKPKLLLEAGVEDGDEVAVCEEDVEVVVVGAKGEEEGEEIVVVVVASLHPIVSPSSSSPTNYVASCIGLVFFIQKPSPLSCILFLFSLFLVDYDFSTLCSRIHWVIKVYLLQVYFYNLSENQTMYLLA